MPFFQIHLLQLTPEKASKTEPQTQLCLYLDVKGSAFEASDAEAALETAISHFPFHRSRVAVSEIFPKGALQ